MSQQQQRRRHVQTRAQEGRLLSLLRSVGYRDELPPSTVAWLESAPVFKFLAARLTADNFVGASEQQEYAEVQLARGADPALYEGVDRLSSCSEDGGEDGEDAAAGAAAASSSNPFLAGPSDDDVAAALEAEEAYVAQLEQQAAALRAASAALDASAQQAAESQGAMFFQLQADAGNRLAAARTEAAQVNADVNAALAALEEASSELARLLACPEHWLLCAARERAAYEDVDAAANDQHWRATQLLDSSDVTMHLHVAPSPALVGATPGAAKTPPPAGSLAAQQQQQDQQAAPLVTPRGGQAKDWTAALQDAQTKRREAHAARNTALMQELGRQRHAFLLALRDVVRSSVEEAGTQAQLTAARQVRACSGEFAALLRQGPAAVPALAARAAELEADKAALEEGPVAALAYEVARLNDSHIIVGDYDRQLAKMEVSYRRRQAVLACLLQRSSCHLLLLLAGLEELGRLAGLGGELQATAGLLEGHVAAAEARVGRCVAAFKALDNAQELANLRPDDTFLCSLLAAAEGRLQLGPGSEEQQPEEELQRPVQQEQPPATPAAPSWPGVRGGLAAAASTAAAAPRTPSYAPSAGLADKLQHLASGVQRSATELQRLLELLPEQLRQHKQVAAALHGTVFPPGQPLYVPGGGGSGGSLAAALSAVSREPSAAGSTWGGSQSAAAASMRSTSSGSGLSGPSGQQHPRPLLVLPEVSEAEAGLDAGLKALQADANRAISQQNDAVKALSGRSPRDAELERRVMALFFGDAPSLAAAVEALAQQVAAADQA